MDRVSVALLSTLLPTCILISMLSSLCVYLYLRCWNSRPEAPTQNPDISAQLEEERKRITRPRTPFKERPLPEYTGPSLLGREICLYFSDLSHPDLSKDMRMVLGGLGWSVDFSTDYFEERADNETRVGEILELLGYSGIPPAVVVKLLQSPATRREVLDHLFLTIVIEKTSLDNDRQTSLLPFSTDIRKDIIAYIKALRGVQFSPSAVKTLMQIPAKIGGETDWPVENRDKTADLIRRLVWPYRNENNMRFNQWTNQFTYFPNCVEKALDDFVYGRFLMLASPQQLEFRWPETPDTCFTAEPDIYATAGEDGVLLDEPKLWRKGKVVTILSEDSTLGK